MPGRSTLIIMACLLGTAAALQLGAPQSSAIDLLDPGTNPAASMAATATQAGAPPATTFISYRVSGNEIALESVELCRQR